MLGDVLGRLFLEDGEQVGVDDVDRIGSEIASVKASAKDSEGGLVFASFGETK
mgnify:CR=1 FL=1